jgi:hypothetical protein
VVGGRRLLRRLPGVPLLRPRRADAGLQRRRGGRVQRGAVPGGLRAERQDPGRRDQRDHRPAAGQGRQAALHRRHLPQRHHPRSPLPLPHVQVWYGSFSQRVRQSSSIFTDMKPISVHFKNWVLAVGESLPPLQEAEAPQRRPGHLHQRLQRRPEIRRQQRTTHSLSLIKSSFSIKNSVSINFSTMFLLN